jgi:hypothetical protein
MIIKKMFNLNDFSVDEVVKVLVDNDGVEDESYASVTKIERGKLYVCYLTPRNKVYKNATLYTFEDSEHPVYLESIIEHHEGVKNITDIGFLELETDWFVYESDIDSECSESEIDDYSSEEGHSFIADEDLSGWEPPEDHQKVDSDWRDWNPDTIGGQHFKQTIDRIEHTVKIYRDNMTM